MSCHNIGCLAFPKEIVHGNHEKLSRGSTCHEKDLPLRSHACELTKKFLRLVMHRLIFARSMRHFHDGHAGSSPIQHFLLSFQQYFHRKRSGPSIKIYRSFHEFVSFLIHISYLPTYFLSLPIIQSANLRRFSSVEAPICGVISTLGASKRGEPSGGSFE